MHTNQKALNHRFNMAAPEATTLQCAAEAPVVEDHRLAHDHLRARREAKRAYMAGLSDALQRRGVAKRDLGVALMDIAIGATDEFCRPLREVLPKSCLKGSQDPTKISTLKDGYIMVVMDSGAGNHVCNPALHFMDFKLHQTAASKGGRVFQTANGTEIRNLGENMCACKHLKGSLQP